jgi:MoxR-like ATPase
MENDPAEASPAAAAQSPGSSDLEAVELCRSAARQLEVEISKVIVGQADVVEQILIAILTRSHALLVGVPGLAKTLLISTLA